MAGVCQCGVKGRPDAEGPNSFAPAGRVENIGLRMKNLLTLVVTASALAAFATTSFAGSCGGCPGEGGKKDKAKTEEGAQS